MHTGIDTEECLPGCTCKNDMLLSLSGHVARGVTAESVMHMYVMYMYVMLMYMYVMLSNH
jgi:hypothetical protein